MLAAIGYRHSKTPSGSCHNPTLANVSAGYVSACSQGTIKGQKHKANSPITPSIQGFLR
jgi:hypothetical protein